MKLIVDIDSNTAIVDDEILCLPTINFFESSAIPSGEFKRRVYFSGKKHYLKSDKSTKVLDPNNEKFDSLFGKIKEIRAVNKKIKSGQIKLPVKFEG